MSISETLNPLCNPKITRSLKKMERTTFRETFNPSTCLPGETLFIQIPKLLENILIVPKKTFLCFEIDIEFGNADNHKVFLEAKVTLSDCINFYIDDSFNKKEFVCQML